MKSQNDFLLRTVFDAKGDYVYHRDCVRAAYGVSTQWLAYSSFAGITSLRDFVVTKEAVQHRCVCYTGAFDSTFLMKSGVNDSARPPDSAQQLLLLKSLLNSMIVLLKLLLLDM